MLILISQQWFYKNLFQDIIQMKGYICQGIQLTLLKLWKMTNDHEDYRAI